MVVVMRSLPALKAFWATSSASRIYLRVVSSTFPSIFSGIVFLLSGLFRAFLRSSERLMSMLMLHDRSYKPVQAFPRAGRPGRITGDERGRAKAALPSPSLVAASPVIRGRSLATG